MLFVVEIHTKVALIYPCHQKAELNGGVGMIAGYHVFDQKYETFNLKTTMADRGEAAISGATISASPDLQGAAKTSRCCVSAGNFCS